MNHLRVINLRQPRHIYFQEKKESMILFRNNLETIPPTTNELQTRETARIISIFGIKLYSIVIALKTKLWFIRNWITLIAALLLHRCTWMLSQLRQSLGRVDVKINEASIFKHSKTQIVSIWISLWFVEFMEAKNEMVMWYFRDARVL